MDRTPNEIGDDFEQYMTNLLGGERVPQSGAGKWRKLDVSDKARIIWSCKATTKGALRVTGQLIREAQRAARGMLGSGDGYKWALAFEVEGVPVVMMHAEDYADMLKRVENGEGYIQPSKAEERRAKARRSLLG